MGDERFEEIEHTADIAIHVWGSGRADLFANAAYGMACQLADPDAVDLTMEREIELEAYDAESLLVNWLEELLYLVERDESLFVEFDVQAITQTRLRAVVRGGPMPERRRYIKAVTFHELEIRRTDEGYETTIVFDV